MSVPAATSAPSEAVPPRRLVLFGNGELSRQFLAELTIDPRVEVAAVAADAAYIRGDAFGGKPLVPFDRVAALYPPDRFEMLVLVGYSVMRRRREAYDRAKAAGYRLANYIAPSAVTYPDLRMGDNNIILSQVYLGPFGEMGSGNIVRTQTYIGHDFRMGDHGFICPGVKIGGFSRIGDLSFVGIGSTLIDGIQLGAETLVAAGSLVTRATDPCGMYMGQPARKVREHPDTGVRLGGS
jgi:sugar O-acyltransferase (sialic acid O-acetyltransferase NeuD family)